jgi:hypothetical protein
MAAVVGSGLLEDWGKDGTASRLIEDARRESRCTGPALARCAADDPSVMATVLAMLRTAREPVPPEQAWLVEVEE